MNNEYEEILNKFKSCHINNVLMTYKSIVNSSLTSEELMKLSNDLYGFVENPDFRSVGDEMNGYANEIASRLQS
jgi:hypothetical protein